MVWPHLKILWHGEDNSAWDSEMSKKERKTEEEMDRNGVWRFPEGSGKQRTVERYCCKECGAPTTSDVKGLRYDKMNGTIKNTYDTTYR